MDDIIMWATVLGLLIGIVWSLKYIVVLDRKLESMDGKITQLLKKKKK